MTAVRMAPNLSPAEAVEAAEAAASHSFPCILAEGGDNTGGGAPGDATHMLRLLLADVSMQPAALMYMVDPQAAAAAHAAGSGKTLQVGHAVPAGPSMQLGDADHAKALTIMPAAQSHECACSCRWNWAEKATQS